MRKQQPPAPEPEKFERWTAQRKVAIILEILKGQISCAGSVAPVWLHSRRGNAAQERLGYARHPAAARRHVLDPLEFWTVRRGKRNAVVRQREQTVHIGTVVLLSGEDHRGTVRQ